MTSNKITSTDSPLNGLRCISLMLALPIGVLDFTCLRVALVLHWPAFQRYRSLWCFTGYYFVDDKRSHTAWRSSCAPDYTLFRCYLLTFKLAWLMSMAVLAPLLWCFTGQHSTHFWCSRVSLATISLTTRVPMLRGAPRPRS